MLFSMCEGVYDAFFYFLRGGDMSERKKMQDKKNLRKIELTHEQAVELGRMGGKKSAEKRQKRKTLKEAYLTIAELPYKPIGEMAKIITENYGDISLDEAIMAAQAVKASMGDTSAASFIRDTIGEKAADKQEMNAVVNVCLQGALKDYAK